MNKRYLIGEHQRLVAQRSVMVDRKDKLEDIKTIDRTIGNLAAVYNHKISAKALAWLDAYETIKL
jgi:hypothetical protein